METQNYIVAIELGTSKIVGIVGYKTGNQLTVVAVESEEPGNSIKRGCIQNLEEAASRIRKIVAKLENRIKHGKITQVYVGIGGQSIHALPHALSMTFPQETLITEAMIDDLYRRGRQYPVGDQMKVFTAIPQQYFVNKQREVKAIGVLGSEIEVKFNLIVGRTALYNRIKRCIEERLELPVAGFSISAIATASILLTPEAKKLGCALVDFGAATTTLSIYKENELCYLVTLPFGGDNITRDICSLSLLPNEAEDLKINLGCTQNPEEVEDTLSTLKPSPKLQNLSRVIEARQEEILENIAAQLVESGFNGHLPAGIFITGGASQLKGLPELLHQKCGLEVHRGTITSDVKFECSSSLITPGLTSAVGLVYHGTKPCVEIKVPKEVVPGTGNPPKEVVVKEVKKRKNSFIPSDITGFFKTVSDKIATSASGFLEDGEQK